jgi:hypothetical protein
MKAMAKSKLPILIIVAAMISAAGGRIAFLKGWAHAS